MILGATGSGKSQLSFALRFMRIRAFSDKELSQILLHVMRSQLELIGRSYLCCWRLQSCDSCQLFHQQQGNRPKLWRGEWLSDGCFPFILRTLSNNEPALSAVCDGVGHPPCREAPFMLMASMVVLRSPSWALSSKATLLHTM